MIKKIEHNIWGNCIEFYNKDIKIIVTLEFGPRILWYGNDEYNILCDSIPKKLGEFEVNDEIYYLRGGHRLWYSPESYPRTYSPDNDKVQYEIKDNCLNLTCKNDDLNNLEKKISIIAFDNYFEIKHKVKNTSNWPITLSLWPITMMKAGGAAVLPLNTADTKYLPNNQINLWDYTRLDDCRVTMNKDYVCIKNNPDNDEAFKIGYKNNKGWIGYISDNYIMIKKFKININGLYPDNNSNVECFTRSNILELETLSCLNEIEPSAVFEYSEKWYFEKYSVKTDSNLVKSMENIF